MRVGTEDDGVDVYAPERHQEILGRARIEGRVDVTSLARELDVTPETIRRDLTALERHGLVRRVHGGAIPVERLGFERDLADREGLQSAEKDRIAKAALDEVPDGGSIILDAGSTTVRLAELAAAGPRAHGGHPRAAGRDRARDPLRTSPCTSSAAPSAAGRWPPSAPGRCATSPTSTPTSSSSAPTGSASSTA